MAETVPPAIHQIPPPPADFTGREIDLRELLDAIQKQDVRILGLRGMGGTGKTVLALKLVEQLVSDFPDAQLFVNLQGVSRQPTLPRDAMEQIIHSLYPHQRLPQDEDLKPYYLSSLYGTRAVILLDNAKDEQQVLDLVPPSGCILLITSRQRFLLPGLYPKDLSSLSRQEARNLLLRIAPRTEGYEEALARLSGDLPLALRTVAKVIANRVDLTPAEYVLRLSEGRETLEPVEASIGLSYDLLVPDVQRRFRALAVFPGTFDGQGAAAVWGMQADAAQAALGELLKHNLVDWDDGESRYRLHDMSRKFADDRLGDDERAAAQLCHARFYIDVLGFANRLYQQGGDATGQGLGLFYREWENTMSGQTWAANYATESNEAAALCQDYPVAGAHLLEILQRPSARLGWSQSALKAAKQLRNRRAESVHESNLGSTYWSLNQHRAAIEHWEKALSISHELEDRRSEGIDLLNLGTAYDGLREYSCAVEYYEKALVICRELSDRNGEAAALSHLLEAHIQLCEDDRATEDAKQLRPIIGELKDPLILNQVLGTFGRLCMTRRDFRLAVAYLKPLLRNELKLNDLRGALKTLGYLGKAHTGLGDHSTAIEYIEQSVTVARGLGDPDAISGELSDLGVAYAQSGQHDKALGLFEKALAISNEIDDQLGAAKSLWRASLSLDEMSQRPAAIARAEAALRILENAGSPEVSMVQEQLAKWRLDKK